MPGSSQRADCSSTGVASFDFICLNKIIIIIEFIAKKKFECMNLKNKWKKCFFFCKTCCNCHVVSELGSGLLAKKQY